MKDRSTLFAFIAVLMMFFGFGMVMGGGSAGLIWVSRAGSVLLGAGSIYLIYRLVKSQRQDPSEEG